MDVEMDGVDLCQETLPASAEGFTIATPPTQKESWADFQVSETPRGVREVDLEEDDQVIGHFDSAEASNIPVVFRARRPPATADASPVGEPTKSGPQPKTRACARKPRMEKLLRQVTKHPSP